MNKLTKVGCSALCGSLAAISAANAGDLTVTGGADLTYVSLGADTTGNPIGMGSNYSLKGSGELDNGWTFGLTIANTNANAYSSTAIDLKMGGLGSLNFNSGDSGNGIQAYDDKMPTAWEEPWGAGLATGMRGLVSGVGPNMNVQYTFPTVVGTTLKVAYAPVMGTTDTADKTGGGVNAEADNNGGIDITVNMNPSLGTEILSGLNIFAGAHNKRVFNGATAEQDAYQGVAGVTYDIGPLSIGTQWSAEYSGEESSTTAYNTYKASAYGVAFNVNDDLSVSYGKWESRKAGYNNSNAQTNAGEDGRRVVVDSWQVAYTMGGASLRVADIKADNALFNSAASGDVSATVVSLGLAF
jgi:hypothetical protein